MQTRYSMYRVTAALILGYLLPMASSLLHAAEPVWLKDSAKGCLILDPNPQPNETVTWSGSCVGGKANGTGKIIWYQNGIPSETENITGESGVTMNAGEYTFNVTSNDVRLELRTCDQGISGYRAVKVFIKKDFALWHNELAMPILDMAGNFAQTNCPTRKGFNNITVQVYYEGDPPNGKYQLHARSYDGKWGELENVARRDFYEPQKQNYATLLAKHQADIQMHDRAAREAQERAQAENARRIVQDRYYAFMRKNGIAELVAPKSLKANPFVYKGKVIAVRVIFSEMVTEDSGLFGLSDDGFHIGEVVVSGVPGNLFRSDNRVILAARVLGKTSVKTPFGGEASVPQLRFVGAHICATYSCSDIVP